MPYSKTIIANMALAHCGVSARIRDVDTENSEEAYNCNLFYEPVRDMLMEMKPWPFCERESVLQLLTGDVPFGYTYRYAYPNFCVRANLIKNPASRIPTVGSKIPFRVIDRADAAGKAIVCDEADAVLIYNHLTEDEGQFTALFAYAFSLGLGANISSPLRVSAEMANRVANQWRDWMAEATLLSLAEGQEDAQQESELMTVRG